MTVAPRRRLGLLFGLGGVSLASLLLVPVEALVPGAARVPRLRLLALVQPAALLAVAILAGHRLAPLPRFRAPLVDALASGRVVLLPAGAVRDGLVVAAGVAGLILGFGAPVAGMAVAAPLLAFEMPLAVRLLWGGIGTELLMRRGR